MCPCSPNDVSFPSPSGPGSPAIPGFGSPFSLPVPQIPYPDGFPEDLLDLMNKLQMLIPPGALKPQLNPNFGKDIYDGIMKLLDQFMPFLMLYKFFLPILNLIICIIEVLCALMNPFALISAINRLFTQCIPEFLNLFPIFALILMIISLLLLLLALILYIIQQILKFINAILRNINALVKAINSSANATAVLTIAKKLGALLCMFQNLFVLLALFAIIIQVIKDILSLIFSIPPCEGGGPGSTDGCCAATYCPTIVQGPYTRMTGTFQYLPEVSFQTSLGLLPGSFFSVDVRQESWQIFDQSQDQAQQFWNIVDAFDVSPSVQPKPIYFPTDATFTAATPPGQAAYTMDLRLLYNPAAWGRPGTEQHIRFKDCIIQFVPTQGLKTYNNGSAIVPQGVFYIVGGRGYQDDGTTKITGFAADGITPISDQATLSNFLHMPVTTNGQLNPADGYTFFNAEYTFKPNQAVLLQKNLINLKCQPAIALNSAFINNVVFQQISLQSAALSDLVNSRNGRVFPDVAGAQECLNTALSNLRSNLTVEGVAEFQTATNLCLDKLTQDTKSAIADAIAIGFNPCKSTFTAVPSSQFTTQSILVTVNINESNGLPLTNGIPTDVAANLATHIKATPTFGTITPFTYDGYQAYTAELTSPTPGAGQIMVAFNNQIFCTDTIPTNGISPTGQVLASPSHDLQVFDYQFIFTPHVADNIPLTGEGDTTGTQPRRGPDDISRDSGGKT